MATLADLLTSKIPPHSMEAERAVLGAILLERDSLPRAVELLRASDFYKEGHRKIFDTMLTLFERNEPVDLVTLSEELKRQNELEGVGGPSALALLVEEAATSAHLLAYGGIVREKALLRDLIRICSEVISQSFEGSQEVEKLLDDAERLIFQISERRMQGSAYPVRAILKDTFEHIERLYERKEHVTGLATGFGKLDEMTSGFQASDFIIIAGRPSMGKTAFALNIAKYAGVVDHKRVLVLSLEMSKEQLVQRLLCAEARVDSHKVRTGYLDPAGLDPNDARRREARRRAHLHRRLTRPVGARGAGQGAPDEGRARHWTSSSSTTCSSCGGEIPRTASRRSPRSRARSRPSPRSSWCRWWPCPSSPGRWRHASRRSRSSRDLRESGALEQDADLILFLYRPERYGLESPDGDRVADVIIGKQRNGPTGKVQVTFIPEYASFENLAPPSRQIQPV